MRLIVRNWRPSLRTRQVLLGASVAALILAPIIVMAEDGGGTGGSANRGDTFPSSLGYAAVGFATVVWGTMTTVVGKLYYGREADKVAHQVQIDALRREQQVQIDALKKENQERVDALKKECRDETHRLRNRLEAEQKERREEAERLLREQKDIMREVMTTSAATNDAFKTNSEAIERLREALNYEAGDS